MSRSFLLSYSLDSSPTTDDTQPLVKKQKKQYYIRANPLPRILKRDIRRDYATMLTNAYNSQDPIFVKSYFEQFYYPDSKFSGFFPGAAKVNYSVVRTADDRNGMISLIQHDTALFPDFSVRCITNKILQREGMTGSKIVIEGEMTGTMVFEDGLCLNVEAMSLTEGHDNEQRNSLKRSRERCSKVEIRSPCTHENNCSIAHGYRDPSTERAEEIQVRVCIQCMNTQKRLRKSYFSISSKPVITLHLDEQHRIYRMELNAKCLG